MTEANVDKRSTAQLAVVDTRGSVPRALTLRRNMTWAVAGRVVLSIGQWLILAVVAKIGSAAMLGEYAFAVAVSMPLVTFARLNLRAVLSTDAEDRFAFQDYVGLTVGNSLVAGVAAGLIGWGLEANFPSGVLFLAVAAVLSLESLCEVVYGLCQRHHRLDRVGMSMVFRGICGTTAFVATLWWTSSLVAALLAAFVSGLFVLVFYDHGSVKSLNQGGWLRRRVASPDGKGAMSQYWKLARIALPLGLATLLLAVNQNAPRYVLEDQLGKEELGVFAGIAVLTAPGLVLVLTLAQAANTRMAECYVNGELVRFRRIVYALVGFSMFINFGVVAGMAVAGDWLLTRLYSPAFAGHHALVLAIMIGAIFQGLATVFGVAVTSMRRFWLPLPAHLVGLVLIVILCKVLVETYGALGAAYALMAYSIYQACLFGVVTFAATRPSATTPESLHVR